MPVTAMPPLPSAEPSRRRVRLRWFGTRPTVPAESLREDFEAPHPLRAATFCLVPLPLPIALWLSGVVPVPLAVGLIGFLVLLALVQGGLGAYDLSRSRQLGDALLRAHPAVPPVSGVAAWRSAELTSARNRRHLSRQMRQLRRETEACTRSGAPSVDRATLNASLIALQRLERRLESSRPVSPLGMLDLQLLSTADFSPLYFPERAEALPAALTQVLATLEPA